MGDPEFQVKPASNKLWRGIVNTFTGIGEIIRQPIVCTKTDGAIGVPVGILNGVLMSFVRTGSGLLDVFTFIVPFDEQVGYNSLLNPDYVWQKAD
jgi:putative exosortase-associated protein (TIGR04073 family)